MNKYKYNAIKILNRNTEQLYIEKAVANKNAIERFALWMTHCLTYHRTESEIGGRSKCKSADCVFIRRCLRRYFRFAG